jgi:hypothetical protein
MSESIRNRLARPIRRSALIPCQVVRERDFTLVARHIVDLSEDGMLVRADGFKPGPPREKVLTGEPMVVSFRAPFSRRWIDAEAFVARVVHGRRPGDRWPALALAFEHMEIASRRLLHRELDWHAPAQERPRSSPLI